MKSTVSRSYVASIKELDRIGMTGVKTFLYVVLAACGASVRSTTPPAAELAELTTKHSMRLAATPVVRGIHDASGNL
jgi:hypothetical protein